jgi:hypothetical protein
MLILAVILTLPMRAQQKPVAPGFSPAKPFTQEQVSNMVRAGLGDDSGAKLIEQRGIDFAPAEDFIQTLKAAGASEAFLKALRAAKPPEPASAKKPLNQVQVFALLVGQVPSHRVTMLVQERGIDFERVATVTAFVTVGFSHARYPSGSRTSSIWMGHAVTFISSKA